MAIDTAQSRSIEDLARECARRASRRDASGPNPCYELFRRACVPPQDQAAWTAILTQYHKLVLHWLDQYATDDTAQEVFTRFWQAQQNASKPFPTRFPNIGAVMAYLKRCAAAVRNDAWRAENKRIELQERLQTAHVAHLVAAHSQPAHAEFHFRQSIRSKFNDEEEQVVFELTYCYDLKPREIADERPDLFPDVNRIYRVKENLLKRLGRDPELRIWWHGIEEPDE
jgi:DNA-directed RNA polymerase specialized sigma24 family protein